MKDTLTMVGIVSRTITRLEKVQANFSGKITLRLGVPQVAVAFETTINAPGAEKILKMGLAMGKGKFAEEVENMQ